eukprot:3024453-Prymnesium_polylepis.1
MALRRERRAVWRTAPGSLGRDGSLGYGTPTSIRPLALHACSADCPCAAHVPAQENCAIGLICGVAGARRACPREHTTLLQSCNYWKNANQQGLPFTLDPRVLYRGAGLPPSPSRARIRARMLLCSSRDNRSDWRVRRRPQATPSTRSTTASVSCTSFTPTVRAAREPSVKHTQRGVDPMSRERVQGERACMRRGRASSRRVVAPRAAAGIIQRMIIGCADRPLGDGEKILAGMASGASSGILCGPMELIMIQQQRKGGGLVGTAIDMVKAGPATFFRGTLAMMAREGIYAGGFLGLMPVVRRTIRETFPDSVGKTEDSARMAAAFVAGPICGIASHPPDTIKTCLQGDIEGTVYKTYGQTYSKIVSEKGVAALWSGYPWRLFRCDGHARAELGRGGGGLTGGGHGVAPCQRRR